MSFQIAFSHIYIYIYFKKHCQRERRMAVVEQRLHDRKELWFPHLVCKNNEFFAWRKTDTAIRTANWPRLNMTNHKKLSVPLSFHKRLRKMKTLPYDSPSKVSTVWGRHHGRLFAINIQYPHFFSVMQSRFEN